MEFQPRGPRMSRSVPLFAALALAASLAPAGAADLRAGALLPPPAPMPLPEALPFFVKLGAAGLFLSEKADISVMGVPLPGANVKVKAQYTATVEIGYHVTPNWAVSITGGLPPVAKVDGAGVIQPFGRLASVRYGPMALTAHYHFDFGAFRPYLGAGPVFMPVLANRDRFLTDFEMRSAFGVAIQGGADFMFTERFGVFVDAKKAWLRSTAKAFMGPAPVRAKVQLDPLILTTGVVARF